MHQKFIPPFKPSWNYGMPCLIIIVTAFFIPYLEIFHQKFLQEYAFLIFFGYCAGWVTVTLVLSERRSQRFYEKLKRFARENGRVFLEKAPKPFERDMRQAWLIRQNSRHCFSELASTSRFIDWSSADQKQKTGTYISIGDMRRESRHYSIAQAVTDGQPLPQFSLVRTLYGLRPYHLSTLPLAGLPQNCPWLKKHTLFSSASPEWTDRFVQHPEIREMLTRYPKICIESIGHSVMVYFPHVVDTDELEALVEMLRKVVTLLSDG